LATEKNIAEFFDMYLSGKKITNLLLSLPNFKFSLTPQQTALISDSSDTITIGRSGTGKTTCFILRLLATEFLYKIKQCQETGQKFSSKMVDQAFGFRSVFMTASSVLAEDVKMFYIKLIEQIKDKLLTKENIATSFNGQKDPTGMAEIVEENLKEIGIDMRGIDLDLEFGNEDLDFEENAQEQAKSRNTAFTSYEDKDFP
jgi:hypothetical protein